LWFSHVMKRRLMLRTLHLLVHPMQHRYHVPLARATSPLPLLPARARCPPLPKRQQLRLELGLLQLLLLLHRRPCPTAPCWQLWPSSWPRR
jgi:hypothetical protein